MFKYKVTFLLVFTLLAGFNGLKAQSAISEDIRINQLGFYPNTPKKAIIVGQNFKTFEVLNDQTQKSVYHGELKSSGLPALNGKHTQIADFSALKAPGDYVIYIPDLGRSSVFRISNQAFEAVAKASVKAYYFQRASTALPEKYAEQWHRAAGHLDQKVLIHPSAATENRPTGAFISSPQGWYDAGDYNKYIVNSGITMGTLLSFYEDFPAYGNTINLNIPESKNNIPDFLDELLWNLRWMLTMQDPEDGGVYHKLTSATFDKMEMPLDDQLPRYVVQKGTAATLDFAAVTAQASRILKKFDEDLPGLADSCLQASKKAWLWAQKNNNIAYNQTEMNHKFSPSIVTGAYGDKDFSDEFTWAACELYLTTNEEHYYSAIKYVPVEQMQVPSWANVRLLGYYSLARNQKQLKGLAKSDFVNLKTNMLAMAAKMISNYEERAYQTVIGSTGRDFMWGSNSLAANQGVALIQAFRLSGDKKFLVAALANLDYLLGRNATGYSYVTGFGDKSPMFPHHRVSVSDGIKPPVPGLLVGGPNPGMQDKVTLPSVVPDEAYIDSADSYATNEIAINWNAPLVYLTNALIALKAQIQ
ncbi:MAG: glycoside hydrolase family 9 protein [Pelobium sp.]